MAIKLKKSGRLQAEIKIGDKTVDFAEVPVPGSAKLKPGQPHSMVGVNLGYRKSRDYQSVHLDVKVEVPVEVGGERKGLEYAIYAADAFLESKEREVDDYLRSLA